MGCRKIEGIIWSHPALEGPFGIYKPKSRAKLAGIRYENNLAKKLQDWNHAQWWHFCDQNGEGWCQTDFWKDFGDWVGVIECKYTYTEEAWKQIFGLYKPVLEKWSRKEVFGVQVCKTLTRETPEEALAWRLDKAFSGRKSVVCWDGKSPLCPPLRDFGPEAQKSLPKERILVPEC